MADKMFTSATGAYGVTPDGDTLPSLTGSFRVAESSSADITVLKGQVLQIDAITLQVSPATANTQTLIGVALQDVTVKDTDLMIGPGDPAYKGPKVVEVCIYGLCKARVSGATVAGGALLSPNASSQVAAGVVTTGTSTIGYAISSTAGSANDLRTIFVSVNRVN